MSMGGAPPGDTKADYGTLADGPRGLFGGTNAPRSSNYKNTAEEEAARNAFEVDRQTTFNRPNQQNAFGSTSNWTTGPDGRPIQTQSFGGPMGQMAGNLQGQAMQATKNPFNTGAPFSFGRGAEVGQFSPGGPFSFQNLQDPGSLIDPSEARKQAFDSAYGQATSRLDPQWQQRESQMETKLLNQGLDPNSEAYKNAMSQLGQQRNDAYTSAQNSAIDQSTAAGNALFNQSLAGRGQNIGLAGQQAGQQLQAGQFNYGMGRDAFGMNADNALRFGAYNDDRALRQHNQRTQDQLLNRGQALGELGQLNQFLGQQGYNQAGLTAGPQLLAAALAQDNSRFRNWNANNQAEGDFWGGIGDFAGKIGGLFGLGK